MRHLASPRKVAVAGIVAAVLLTAATAAAADSNEYRRFPNPPPDPARCTMTPVDVTVAVAAATATPVTIPLEGAEPVLVARGLAADFADFVNVGTPQVGDLFASLPAAPPADRAAITALETEFAACRNTGDFRRWFAFYTPTLQREIVAALGDQVADFFRPDSLSLDDWVRSTWGRWSIWGMAGWRRWSISATTVGCGSTFGKAGLGGSPVKPRRRNALARRPTAPTLIPGSPRRSRRFRNRTRGGRRRSPGRRAAPQEPQWPKPGI